MARELMDLDWNINWSAFKETPSIESKDVHLWRVSLVMDEKETNRLSTILSRDEQKKASQFNFSKHRNRYIATHGLLRSILALYLQVDPKLVTFEYSQYGKPSLSNKLKDSKILFNLSRSNDMALFAFAYGRDIGVDIEYISDNLEFMGIAESNFSPSEFSALSNISDSMKKEAFFHYWTCKEAYIKAIGLGLSYPLEKVEISPFPDDPVTLIDSTHSNEDYGRWQLKNINCEPGYAAAVVVEGNDWDMKLFRW